MTTVGVLHPGQMGSAVAGTVINSGNRVYWASEGRSAETHQRAEEWGLEDAGTLQALCDRCEVLLSICPPHAAEDVAGAALAAGFRGLYIDANAIAPQTAQRIGARMGQAGAVFVDGGIMGGPPKEVGRTWLYLSGGRAAEAAELFRGGLLETEVLSSEVGQASALKMCYAAITKGQTALLCLAYAAARQLGVQGALENQFAQRDRGNLQLDAERISRVTGKAWRFAGEMEEIADTMASVGLPDGFHLAAAELYRRIAPFKDAEDMPDLAAVLDALAGR